MRRLVSVVGSCCACLLLILGISVTPAAAAKSKTCICHIPPGNPDNAHTICVGGSALSAHLHHGDTPGTCPVVCGGTAGDTCGDNQFCKRDTGVCSQDSPGQCATFPPDCPTTANPVCGCNGTTYDNACLAEQAGVSIEHPGACDGSCGEPVACGGNAGDTCTDTQFCKHADGACATTDAGTCTETPATCPPDSAPVCGCDNVTYTNACFADVAGITVLHAGACTPGVACGGAGGATCATGQFCKPPEGDCAVGAAGSCAPIPPSCSTEVSPVCGCNGTTYDNACLADLASVGVDHPDECAADVVACGGAAPPCPTGQFCSRPSGSGCDPAVAGVCEPASPACPAIIARVCGCDGKTYDNACVANAAGVAIDHDGVCAAVQACGGASGTTCDAGKFCLKLPGTCAVADQAGVCATLPTLCLTPINPVCGCDAVTYNNACLAAAAGVNVNHTGACP